jgi:hypothetical protein
MDAMIPILELGGCWPSQSDLADADRVTRDFSGIVVSPWEVSLPASGEEGNVDTLRRRFLPLPTTLPS